METNSDAMNTTPQKIGLFGGTFNPVHNGHVAIVEASLNYLDQVVVMPCRISPHKLEQQDDPHFASGEDRFQMLELCFGEMEGVEVSRWEIDREGVSYTWETIEYLHAQYPRSEIYLVLGRDQFDVFDTWHRFDLWKNKVGFLLFQREGVSGQDPTELTHGSTVVRADEKIPSISSTGIRQQIASGTGAGQELCTEDVVEYLEEEMLYIALN